jgi:hypothetical protein
MQRCKVLLKETSNEKVVKLVFIEKQIPLRVLYSIKNFEDLKVVIKSKLSPNSWIPFHGIKDYSFSQTLKIEIYSEGVVLETKLKVIKIVRLKKYKIKYFPHEYIKTIFQSLRINFLSFFREFKKGKGEIILEQNYK